MILKVGICYCVERSNLRLCVQTENKEIFMSKHKPNWSTHTTKSM